MSGTVLATAHGGDGGERACHLRREAPFPERSAQGRVFLKLTNKVRGDAQGKHSTQARIPDVK